MHNNSHTLIHTPCRTCVRASWYCSGVMGTWAWILCRAAAAGVSMPMPPAGVAPVKKPGVMPTPPAQFALSV